MRNLLWTIVLLLLPVISLGQLAWNDHVIDGEAGDPYNGGLPTIHAVDLDGDGDQDVIGYPSYEPFLGRWINVDGSGLVWEETVLRSGYNVTEVVDVNNDGIMDMVGISYATHQAYWMEDISAPAEDIIYHIIQPQFSGVPSVSAADIDGDGDVDVVAGSGDDEGYVKWWENVDGDGLTWTETIIDPAIENISHVNTADVDNDGDIDVLGAADHPGLFVWWSNEDGQGETWTFHLLSDAYSSNKHITSADLDGDGDTDLLGVDYIDNGVVYWLQEDDGSWSEGVLDFDINDNYPGSREVVAADFDADGDIDVVQGLQFDNRILLWENVNGDASVWVPHQVGGSYEGVWPVDIADMNGDGAMDVLAGTHDAGQMKWWEQPVDQTITITPGVTVIPPGGGTLQYALELTNDTPNRIRGLTYWTELLLPDGERYGPLFTRPFTMPATLSMLFSGLDQNIPAFAPEGNYAFIANAGSMDEFRLTDTFGFTKLAVGGQTDAITNWDASGSIDIAAEEMVEPVVLPMEYGMSTAYPNPFNPSTTLSVNLPEAGELNVSVFNVTGQQVAILANGQYAAGSHVMNFDASRLSGGVYFVHASANGWSEVQKVVLLK